LVFGWSSTTTWPGPCCQGREGRVARIRWSTKLLWSMVVGAVGIAPGLPGGWCPSSSISSTPPTMGWLNVDGFPQPVCSRDRRGGSWAVDVIGLAAMVVRRNRVSLVHRRDGVGSPPEWSWPRSPGKALQTSGFLPLWFLCLYLLAGVGGGRRHRGAWPGSCRRRRVDRWVEAVERSEGRRTPRLATRHADHPVTGAPVPRPRPPAAIAGLTALPDRRLGGRGCRHWPSRPATLSRVGVDRGGPINRAHGRRGTTRATRQKADYPEYKSLMKTHGLGRGRPGLWGGPCGSTTPRSTASGPPCR